MNDKHHEHHHKHHDKHDDDDKDTTPPPPPPPAAPDPRPGFTWVDQKDGVAAHWERERATAPSSDPATAPGGVTVNPGGTGPVVRDHRDEPPVVPGTGADPNVRDHRAGAPANAPGGGVTTGPAGGGPTVRDHRSDPPPVVPPPQDSGPTIRDHRSDPPPFVSAPPTDPNVRDHRDGDQGGVSAREAAPNIQDFQAHDLDDLVTAGQAQAADFLSSSESNLDDLPAQPLAPAGVDIRDHRDPTPSAEVRDHRSPDVVNVADDVATSGGIPDLLGNDSLTANFDSGLGDQPVSLDDWEAPVASIPDHDATADVAAFSLNDDSFAGTDDTYGSDDGQLFTPLDTDSYAADADSPEHADAID